MMRAMLHSWRKLLPEAQALPLLGAALILYLFTLRPFFGRTVDDAFISLRYAQNWAAGCGPVYSCGQPAVEGYTNFLWVALEAIAFRLGLDALLLARCLGLLTGFGALLALRALCRRLHAARAAELLPLLGLASSPFWAANATTGIETLTATLSVCLAALLSLDLPGRGRPWAAGVAWAVSYLLRPDALPLAVLTGLWSLGAGWRLALGWRRTLRGTTLYAVGFLVIAGPYFIWRLLYYQSLFANTFLAKRRLLATVLPHNLKLLAEHWPFFLALLLAALAVTAVALVRRRGAVLYLLLLALSSAAISFTVHNEFWRPGHRLFLTATALLFAVAAGVADWGRARPPPSRWRWLGPGLLAALLAVVVGVNWSAQPATRALAELHYAADDHPARAMGLRIRALARPGDWLIIRDAGMVPFYAGPGVNVLDMHDRSLNDRRIAEQGWNLRYVMERDPRFVVLVSYIGHQLQLSHPNEGQILNSPGFRQRYRQVMTVPWHRARHFFLFVRD